jgi:hypothetical protein
LAGSEKKGREGEKLEMDRWRRGVDIDIEIEIREVDK